MTEQPMQNLTDDEKTPNLNDAMELTITDGDLSGIRNTGAELVEVAFDSFLQEGIAKDIPIVGTLMGLASTTMAVRDRFFVRKVAVFLNKFDGLTKLERQNGLKKLKAESDADRVGEAIIFALDQAESSKKAALLGNLFRMLCLEELTLSEFWQLNDAILEIPMRLLLQFPIALQQAPEGVAEKENLRSLKPSTIGQKVLSSGLGRQAILTNGYTIVIRAKLAELLLSALEKQSN